MANMIAQNKPLLQNSWFLKVFLLVKCFHKLFFHVVRSYNDDSLECVRQVSQHRALTDSFHSLDFTRRLQIIPTQEKYRDMKTPLPQTPINIRPFLEFLLWDCYDKLRLDGWDMLQHVRHFHTDFWLLDRSLASTVKLSSNFVYLPTSTSMFQWRRGQTITTFFKS